MELMNDNVYTPPRADLIRKNHNGEVTTLMIDHLQVAAKWAKFLSIMGYLVMIIVVISGVMFFIAGPTKMAMGNSFAGLAVGAVIFFISFFILFKICRFLQQYAYFNRQLLETNDAYDLIEAQEYFRCYVKWVGVLSLISTMFGVVAAAGMLGAGFLMRGM